MERIAKWYVIIKNTTTLAPYPATQNYFLKIYLPEYQLSLSKLR